MDVAYQMLIRVLGALLWSTAAWHKLRSPRQFWGLLEAYAITLPAARVLLWGLLVAAEASLALAFCLWPRVEAPACASAAVLLFYAAVLAREILVGRVHHPCGCGGPWVESRIGWGLVVRNVIVAGLFVVACSEAEPRQWTWLDTVTVTGGATASVALYLAISALVQQLPPGRVHTTAYSSERG